MKIEEHIYSKGASFLVHINRGDPLRKCFKTIEETRGARDALLADNPPKPKGSRRRSKVEPEVPAARRAAARKAYTIAGRG